jgi:hypothetical protein
MQRFLSVISKLQSTFPTVKEIKLIRALPIEQVGECG